MQGVIDDFLRSHPAIDLVAISPEQVLDRNPTTQASPRVSLVPSALRLDEPDQFLEVDKVESGLEVEQPPFLLIPLHRVFQRPAIRRLTDLIDDSIHRSPFEQRLPSPASGTKRNQGSQCASPVHLIMNGAENSFQVFD